MMRALLTLVAGTIFGAGLAISGMADPMRVRAFLDVFGAWDPTLAFVMCGALIPMALAWSLKRQMTKPLVGHTFALPDTRVLDGRLIVGATLFGIGWGIAGLCPGPALVDLALAPLDALVFVAAMLVGIAVHRLVNPQTK